MGTDEPLELLQLARMADEHVLGDQIELFESLDALAGVLDDADVDEVQGGQLGVEEFRSVARPTE